MDDKVGFFKIKSPEQRADSHFSPPTQHPMSKLKNKTVSSSAQYLTFIAATDTDEQNIEMRYEDENIWMTQKMMAELYGVSVQMIGQHIKKLTTDGEISYSYKAILYNCQ